MKRLKYALMGALCMATTGYAEEGSILWWMFEDKTPISDVNGIGATYTIDTLEGRGSLEGVGANGIRISAYNGDTLLGYLTIADAYGEAMDYYELPSVVKVGGEYVENWNAGPTYAWLGEYASTPGVSFMIELGNWDDSLGIGNEWQILAQSEAARFEELGDFIYASPEAQHTKGEWTGGAYAVPEPSGGLLMLIGGALLALRRKRGVERS